MWYEKDPSIIDAKLIENRDYAIAFELQYLGALKQSDCVYKRDFLIERKRSFDIEGIDLFSYKKDLWNSNLGLKFYNNMSLELKYEGYVSVYLLGRKMGYIRQDQSEDVRDIIWHSKHYWATFNRSVIGFERADITFLQEFKDETTLPFQTDLLLTATCAPSIYNKFIKSSIGHMVSFYYSNDKKKMAIQTDMMSVLGYIEDSFIERQNQKTEILGFIEDATYDQEERRTEVKLRLLMEKSVVNRNYVKSYQALSVYFGEFNDAGIYCISLPDLVRIAPRKNSRDITAYEPLVNYLKDYHGITLRIEQ